MNGNVNSLLSKSILEMDQFIVERVNINQSNVPSRRVWLFTLSPDKQSLLLFSNQPIQLKTRSACVLVADLEFVKKFTRPNFRAEKFYTLKTRKLRLFSPAINSDNASLSVIWASFG